MQPGKPTKFYYHNLYHILHSIKTTFLIRIIHVNILKQPAAEQHEGYALARPLESIESCWNIPIALSYFSEAV